ncbi:hypothetical protein [Actinomyces bowdenii]|uniref:Uncharacterized protein n=1 Tax=Actinomyces bowdenii TaxID=131109 RepID=A0A3P1V9L8_9ACTO|nr:hypothetical protein [Actinomyces bowdenii]RRD30831.1 hypothetical protein EII10_01630 [Actinomyces bowdenii]
MSITVETGRIVLVLKEASVDMDQELADYLVAVTGSRQRPPYRHEPDVGECNDTIWSDHLARDLLIRLARVTVGVVADDPVRMLWLQNDHPPMRHDDEEEPWPPVRAGVALVGALLGAPRAWLALAARDARRRRAGPWGRRGHIDSQS